MTNIYCACPCVEQVGSVKDEIEEWNYFCTNPLSFLNPIQSHRRIGFTKQTPEWCPLKIKYSFPYHIVRVNQ
jgi:hypothetical protein